MVDVSFVLPCRNEEKTIGLCIDQIKKYFKKYKIDGEIIVSDSSSDNSWKIAKEKKVILIKHNQKGYGVACLKGISKANGKYIFISDADGTYDFSQLNLFINKIKQGYDIVLGSRLKGKIDKEAMPFLHRYLGNPLLSGMINLFFGTKISDAHSGFRLVKKISLKKLNLKTTGMEFASEMIIKAAKLNLRIGEVPINYKKRIGQSKLSSFSDGWRHLRFILLFSPTYLFFIPGTILLFVGLIFLLSLSIGFNSIISNGTGTFIAFVSSFSAILGYQVLNLGLYARIFATHTGYETHDNFINLISSRITLEKSLIIGLIIILLAIILQILLIRRFSISRMLFNLIIFVIGFQTLFSAFFLSMMAIEKRNL